MELKWLEDFISIASTGSFSESAIIRHTTQPTLSRRIQALESWLGAELIDRAPQVYQLTPTGKEFLSTAIDISSRIKAERCKVTDKNVVRNKSSIFILVDTALLTHFLPNWLVNLKQRFGQTKFTIKAARNMHSGDAIFSHDVEFVLAYSSKEINLAAKYLDFNSVELLKEKFMPVSNVNHENGLPFELPGSKQSPIPFVTYSDKNDYLSIIQDKILMKKIAQEVYLEPIFRSPTMELKKQFLLEYPAIGWFPESTIKKELKSNQLLGVGNEQWCTELEVRLFKRKKILSDNAKAIWDYVHSNHLTVN